VHSALIAYYCLSMELGQAGNALMLNTQREAFKGTRDSTTQ
jgi:hypothetical protein